MDHGPESGFSHDQAKPETYTPAQAATVLNVSKRQVLNFLNRGELVGDKDPDTGRWSIPRSHMQQLRQHREEEERKKPPKPDEKNADLVEALRDQIEDLRARLDREQEANRENRRIIAGLIERVPELEAPQEPQNEPESAESRSDRGAAPPTAKSSKPWYLRLLGR